MALLTALALVAGCAAPPPPAAPYDPYEAQNRRTHQLNLAIDRSLIRPLSGADTEGPARFRTLRQGLANLADNLDQPRVVVNDLLQGRIDDAAHNTARFVVNTVFGLGGLFDVAAADAGLEKRDTDFGETLHVWGMDEGAYLVWPVIGPSTERDTIGDVVDIFLNPMRFVLTVDQRRAASGVKVLAEVSERGDFSGAVDSVLYDSIDSYVELRSLYLQNRRFELGYDLAGEDDPEAEDIDSLYEELYGP